MLTSISSLASTHLYLTGTLWSPTLEIRSKRRSAPGQRICLYKRKGEAWCINGWSRCNTNADRYVHRCAPLASSSFRAFNTDCIYSEDHMCWNTGQRDCRSSARAWLQGYPVLEEI